MKKMAAAALLGAVGLALLAWTYGGFIKSDMSDFGVPYRNAGRFLSGETLYRTSDGHLQYKYAPVSALFYAPLARLPLETAKAVWFCLEIGFLAGIFAVGYRILPVKRKGPVFVVGIALPAMLKFIGRELELGQVNLLIIFVLVLMTAATLKKRDLPAGALWAASIFFKPYALVFLPYFALRRKFRLLAWGTAVLLAGLAAPALFYGVRGNLQVHREWISSLSLSTPGLMAVGDNASLYAFLWKLLLGRPESAVRILWGVLGAAAAALFLWMLRAAATQGAGGEVLEAAFLLVLVPVFSPLGWYYNYLYAVPALIVLLNAWPLLSGTWKGILAADLVIIGGTLREVLGTTLFRFYTHHSLVVLNIGVLLAVLAHVRARRIA
jgi:hypothetical protein